MHYDRDHQYIEMRRKSLAGINQQGITLIELIIVVAILGMLAASISFFITQGFQIQTYSFELASSLNEARTGVETMVKEIRETQIADNGAFPIFLADDNTFIFYGDIDKDAAVERVRYFLSGTDFKKGIIEPTQNPITYLEQNEVITTITRYVQNDASTPVFTYYDNNWPTDTANNPLPTPADVTKVSLIHVFLKINVNPSRAPTNFNLESDVHIRNLKHNL